MTGPKKILNWMSIDVDPDVITRYQKKNKVPPAKKPVELEANKKRGPIKAFFHITKNENVPAIEQQGLLANHPNANINSAFQPFRKHGSKGGGVWVTTEPTAFPVYGTTIGGKNGDASARADALSTFKIEVPVSELPKMRAVQDPYGKNILRKGNDPRAVEKFGTWAGIDVPTTVFLNDMKPEWLKNIGYVEENAPSYRLIDTDYFPLDMEGSWRLDEGNPLRGLDKSRLRDISGWTGHRHSNPQDAAKSPKRFVDDYLNRNQPITERLPVFPVAPHVVRLARLQVASPGYASDLRAKNGPKRYSANFIPAFDWSNNYQDYIKPGEPVNEKLRRIGFAPGAISRGMGGALLPPIKERHFDWNKYNKLISEGDNPHQAAFAAQPAASLDWDNIVKHNIGGYRPQIVSGHDFDALSDGAITRGMYPVGTLPERLASEVYDLNDRREELRKLIAFNNYGAKFLPGQINNPKMQAILNKYVDRLALPDISRLLHAPVESGMLREGPYRDYINERYTVRNQQINDLYDAEDKLAIKMSKHKRLHESELRKLFELMDQRRSLTWPSPGEYPPGLSYRDDVENVLRRFKVLDKLSEQDKARARTIIEEELEK